MESKGRCPACGASVPAGMNYCPNCRATLPGVAKTVAGSASGDSAAQGPASTGVCPYCGATLRSDQKHCPACGAENPHYVADTPRRIFHPKTIEELKEYCAERGMPLVRMRFFVGENTWEPRAFGIYRQDDRFVVYKNKANGNRAVRYDGPDEAYAVNEIFQKLLSECHNRGIYPDGKPAARDVSSAGSKKGASGRSMPNWLNKVFKGLAYFLFWPTVASIALGKVGKSNKGIWFVLRLLLAVVLGTGGTMIHLMLLVGLPIAAVSSAKTHREDGYYRYEDQSVYYRQGNDVYYANLEDDWWSPASYLPYYGKEEAFLGKEYSSDWGFLPFDQGRSGYADPGYYRLEDGNWYYCYGGEWFLYDQEQGAWEADRKQPQCPAGFKQEGAYLGWNHDPAWDVQDVDKTFYIGTLKDWHSWDGYYRFGQEIYYYYGYNYDRAENWYAYGETGWASAPAPEGSYEEAYLGPDLDSAWGLPDAKESFAIATQEDRHSRDGYYRFGDSLYYYYGNSYDTDSNWYGYDDGEWARTDPPQGSYDTTYAGEDWDSDWGTDSFTDSSAWDDLHPSYSSSGSSYDSGSSWDSGSSYDSWDSGGTDWDSDW